MRDFEAYYAAGTAANSGVDPYSAGLWRFEQRVDPQAKTFELLPFVSPPEALYVLRAFALIPVDAATVIWRLFLLGCIFALAVTLLSLCMQRITPWTLLAGACAAVGFAPLTSALALGQLALPAYAAAAGALGFPPAAIAAWLQPNVALVLFSRLPRRTTLWTLTGALLAALPLSAAYVRALGEHSLAERFSAIQVTPEAIAYGFGAPENAASAIGAAVALGAFAAWIVCMRRLETPLQRFCASCALLPLGMPFFHEHDLIVTFVPAGYWMLRCRPHLWPLAAVGAVLCAVDWLGLAQRPDGAVQSALLAFAFLAALTALRNDLQIAAVAGPAAILGAIFVAAATAAQHNVLPVWPDGMHALQQHAFSSAASAWHAEQNATGLFARNPAWSALRALSLLGCCIMSAAALLRLDVDVLHVVERREAAGTVAL